MLEIIFVTKVIEIVETEQKWMHIQLRNIHEIVSSRTELCHELYSVLGIEIFLSNTLGAIINSCDTLQTSPSFNNINPRVIF